LKKDNILLKIIVAITTIVVFYFSLFFQLGDSSNNLEIDFLDVGQGDAILVKTPEGKVILIDAGPSDYVVTELSNNLPPFKKNIDLAILTHPHADHLEGFLSLKDYYTFDKVVQLPINHTSNIYLQWLEYLENEKIEVLSVTSSDQINIEDDLFLNVLWPNSLEDLEELSLNNTSIVFLLEYKNVKALFMGDAEQEVENILLERNVDVSADLLKVSHHGSDTGTTDEFMEEVNPKISIISVGENSFGHPNEDVINKLISSGSSVYRTDELGTIKVFSDGDSFWIND
jgi:competence protein ComEC